MSTETVTLSEAHRRLGISDKTLRKAIKAGQIHTIIVGTSRRIAVMELERFVAGSPVADQDADR